MTVKKIENVPQTILVSFESFQKGMTITFDELVFPCFGLINAALTFSKHSGNDFRADHLYILYDDFRVRTPVGLTKHEINWLHHLKPLIVDNKAISPEMWQ